MDVTIYGETGITSYGNGILNNHFLETTSDLAIHQIIVLNGERYRVVSVTFGTPKKYTLTDVRGLF